MTDDVTLRYRRIPRRDPRLGRNLLHDSRSLRYLVRAADPATLQSKRHQVFIPILDQLNEGSCTGHSSLAQLCSAVGWAAAQKVVQPDAQQAHLYARQIYCDATALDPWPGQFEPDDTGSDGLSVAKVLQSRGLISGYLHATSLEATLTALAQQVVIVGTNWLEGMFNPLTSGQIPVTGATAGGHEYALDEIDVERKRVWVRNSWGPSWGVAGRAWLSWDDLGKLLADDGDCTVFVPRTEPPPQPAPAPTPSVDPKEKALADALRRWIKASSAGPRYLRVAAQDWLQGK